MYNKKREWLILQTNNEDSKLLSSYNENYKIKWIVNHHLAPVEPSPDQRKPKTLFERAP